MKKIIAKILICCMCFVLVACGSGKPNNISQNVYDKGIKIVEITESYLNAEISRKDAKDKISFLIEQIEGTEENRSGDHSVKIQSFSIETDLVLNETNEIEGNLNKLKELLGK